MKANNALVTYSDLTTMGLTQKSTPPTGSRIATKSFINTYYYVDNSGTFSSYENNRCVPYQYIIGSVPNSATFYYFNINTSVNPVAVNGFSTSSDACSHGSGGSVTAYYYGSFTNGTQLFYDTSGTKFVSDGGFYSMNGYSFQLSGNTIYNLSTCSILANWTWTNNNVVEGSGGNIQIYKNGVAVVSQYDTGNFTPTTFSGNFSIVAGDTLSVTVYSYANPTYGTETILTVQSPSGNTIYYNTDTQPSPGAPSSLGTGTLYPTNTVSITASSNSY